MYWGNICNDSHVWLTLYLKCHSCWADGHVQPHCHYLCSWGGHRFCPLRWSTLLLWLVCGYESQTITEVYCGDTVTRILPSCITLCSQLALPLGAAARPGSNDRGVIMMWGSAVTLGWLGSSQPGTLTPSAATSQTCHRSHFGQKNNTMLPVVFFWQRTRTHLNSVGYLDCWPI